MQNPALNQHGHRIILNPSQAQQLLSSDQRGEEWVTLADNLHVGTTTRINDLYGRYQNDPEWVGKMAASRGGAAGVRWCVGKGISLNAHFYQHAVYAFGEISIEDAREIRAAWEELEDQGVSPHDVLPYIGNAWSALDNSWHPLLTDFLIARKVDCDIPNGKDDRPLAALFQRIADPQGSLPYKAWMQNFALEMVRSGSDPYVQNIHKRRPIDAFSKQGLLMGPGLSSVLTMMARMAEQSSTLTSSSSAIRPVKFSDIVTDHVSHDEFVKQIEALTGRPAFPDGDELDTFKHRPHF